MNQETTHAGEPAFNLLNKLPILLQENSLGMLSETALKFTPYSAHSRSQADIHWLFRPEETGGCGAALVRYQPGGESPLHLHTGYELAYILEGEMITNQGVVKKNALLLLPPGSQHCSRSEAGCLALIIWEKAPQTIEA